MAIRQNVYATASRVMQSVFQSIRGGVSFLPSSLDNQVLWYQNTVVPVDEQNTAGSQLNNSGSGPDGKLFSGSAYEFVPATEDRIELQYNIGSVTSYEQGIWFKTSLSAAQALIDFRDDTFNGSRLSVLASGKVELLHQDNLMETLSTYNDGNWYYAKGKWDGSDITLTIYDSNGVQQEEVTEPEVRTFSVNGFIKIGSRSISSASNLMNGQLSRPTLRINNTTFDLEDLITNPQGSTADMDGVLFDYLLQEKFQQKEGAVIDYSGNGNHGTFKSIAAGAYNPVINGIEVGFQPALAGYNRYVAFDGVDNFVGLASLDFSSNTELTWEFKNIIFNSNSNEIFLGTGSPPNRLLLYLNGSVIIFQSITPSDGVIALNGGVIDLNKSYDIAITMKITAGGNFERKLFIDDIEVATSTLTAGAQTDLSFINQGWEVGRRNTDYFQGTIGKVSVYNDFIDSDPSLLENKVHEYFGYDYIDRIGSIDGIIGGSLAQQNIYGSTYDAANDLFGNTIQTLFKNQILNFSDIENDTGINKLECGNLGNLRTISILMKFNDVSDHTFAETNTTGTIALTSNAIVASEFNSITVDGGANSITVDTWHVVQLTADSDVDCDAFAFIDTCVEQVSTLAYSGTKKSASELADLRTYLQSLKD